MAKADFARPDCRVASIGSAGRVQSKLLRYANLSSVLLDAWECAFVTNFELEIGWLWLSLSHKEFRDLLVASHDRFLTRACSIEGSRWVLRFVTSQI